MRHGKLFLSVTLFVLFGSWGCGQTARDLDLDTDLARDSLRQALQVWVDGGKPEDLQPKITMGDQAWASGTQLLSFELLTAQEMSDGTNLFVPVACETKDPKGKVSKTEVIYIIGTSPVITIVPQQI